MGRVSERFEIVCEIEPPTRPDLVRVRHQIGVLSTVASSFLIPDNHIGRATVSSIAVAHEVESMGGRAIACLNARDRNLLGFRRDLLTAAAYGVDQFLFVYGDRPSSGARTGQLTVQSMIEELQSFCAIVESQLGGAGKISDKVYRELTGYYGFSPRAAETYKLHADEDQEAESQEPRAESLFLRRLTLPFSRRQRLSRYPAQQTTFLG